MKKVKKYTAFVLQFGQYEYNRVSFGFYSAARVFQRCMRDIFNGLGYLENFLDDLLIFSKDLEDHRMHLKTVLKIIKENKNGINY